MLPLPPVFSPNALSAALLNALLQREPWAAGRLSRHAGKSLRFSIGAMQVAYSIEASGRVRVCNPAVVPDVTLSIATHHLADLPAILRSRDLAAITEKLHVQGDAALAALVSELARDLRWDIEEDMAARFGDLLGPGLLQGGRAAAGAVQNALQRAGANMAEYLGEEGQVLATRPGLQAFRADCATLQQRLEALEQRLAGVERRAKGG